MDTAQADQRPPNEIQIWVDVREPLCGRATGLGHPSTDDRQAPGQGVAFEGWLGLLHVLSELLDAKPGEAR